VGENFSYKVQQKRMSDSFRPSSAFIGGGSLMNSAFKETATNDENQHSSILNGKLNNSSGGTVAAGKSNQNNLNVTGNNRRVLFDITNKPAQQTPLKQNHLTPLPKKRSLSSHSSTQKKRKKAKSFAVYNDQKYHSTGSRIHQQNHQQRHFDYEEEPDSFQHKSLEPIAEPPVTFLQWDEEQQQHVNIHISIPYGLKPSVHNMLLKAQKRERKSLDSLKPIAKPMTILDSVIHMSEEAEEVKCKDKKAVEELEEFGTTMDKIALITEIDWSDLC